jgi:flagellar protein FlaJ
MATETKPIVVRKSRGIILDSLTYIHLGLTTLVLVGFILLMVVFLAWPDGRLASSLPGFLNVLATKYYTESLILLFFAILGPYVWQRNRAFSRLLDMESRFPEWLIDVAEAKEAGMTLAQAVYSTASSNYGALTKEARRMATEISWGRSFERVLSDFAIRSKSKFIASTIYTIIAANRAGGEITVTIRSAAESADKRQNIRKEQAAGMKQYVYMSYFSFMIFVAVVYIVYTSFLTQLGSLATGGLSFSAASTASEDLTKAEVNQKLFHYRFVIKILMIESAIGGGIYAGVLEKGSAYAGLKHAVALLAVAYIGIFVTFGYSII